MICHSLLRNLRLQAKASTYRRASFASQALQRDSRYAALDERDVEVFVNMLGSQNVVHDTEALETGNRSRF